MLCYVVITAKIKYGREVMQLINFKLASVCSVGLSVCQ